VAAGCRLRAAEGRDQGDLDGLRKSRLLQAGGLARAAAKQQERQGGEAPGAPAARIQGLEGGTPVPGSFALGGCGGAP
jgi:hypothetical protein